MCIHGHGHIPERIISNDLKRICSYPAFFGDLLSSNLVVWVSQSVQNINTLCINHVYVYRYLIFFFQVTEPFVLLRYLVILCDIKERQGGGWTHAAVSGTKRHQSPGHDGLHALKQQCWCPIRAVFNVWSTATCDRMTNIWLELIPQRKCRDIPDTVALLWAREKIARRTQLLTRNNDNCDPFVRW